MWSVDLKVDQEGPHDSSGLKNWLEGDSDLGEMSIHSSGHAGEMGVGEVIRAIVQDGGVGLASLLVSVGAWIDAHRMSAKANNGPSVEIRKDDRSVIITNGDPSHIAAAVKALIEDDEDGNVG